MHAIAHHNLSHAWAWALRHLMASGGKGVHLAVAVERPLDPEDESIRSVLDAFLAERRAADPSIWPVSTVANTMFPSAFYRPGSESARERLYRLHAKAQRLHDRLAHSDTYFNRLVAYPVVGREPFNQLEYVVERLISQQRPRKGGRGGPLSSAYEVGLTAPAGADLRVQAPGQDKNILSFPCLSHISFTLDAGVLNLAALYRNQYFVTRAYGNYLGLARIGDFIAREAGVEFGEVLCLATHADAQLHDLGKARVEHLADTVATALKPIEALSA